MTVDRIDFTRSRTDYGKALQDSMVLNDLIPYLRHAVIVDTNIVLQNLAWMAKHDKDTILVQLAKSHKVVIWFPRSGVAEVEEHIGDVAKANPIIETRMIELWTQTIRLLLHVVPDLDMPAPEHLELQLQARDPDDIPFLQTLFGLRPDYLVSRDKDLISLNITAEDPIQSWMDLRNYHTGQSIRVSLETMGLAFGLGATGATYGLFHAGKVLVNSIRKSPTWLKVLLGLALIIVFAIPKSRSWILNQAETGKTALGTAYQNNKEPIAQAIQTFIDTLEDAKAMEQRARDQLDSWYIGPHNRPKTMPSMFSCEVQSLCLPISFPDESNNRDTILATNGSHRILTGFWLKILDSIVLPMDGGHWKTSNPTL